MDILPSRVLQMKGNFNHFFSCLEGYNMEAYFNGTILIFSPKVSSLGTASHGGAPAWH